MDQSLVSVDHKSTVLEKNLIYLTYLLWLLFSQSNIPFNFDIILGLENGQTKKRILLIMVCPKLLSLGDHILRNYPLWFFTSEPKKTYILIYYEYLSKRRLACILFIFFSFLLR